MKYGIVVSKDPGSCSSCSPNLSKSTVILVPKFIQVILTQNEEKKTAVYLQSDAIKQEYM